MTIDNGQLSIISQSTGSITMRKRDCFELLSAYLDGEVTANERRQVEEWLSTDKAIRDAYKKQLHIRQELRNMPIPASEHSCETIIQQVFARVNRRYQLKWILSGSAIAACVCATINGVLPSFKTFQIAENNILQTQSANIKPIVINSSPMVALNNPVMEIPKTAIAPSSKLGNDLN
ncbi:anti-sigma factor [Anabaena sp. FACHB-1237]|uniref:anti-sigma factor family protein n=1 Tax=Anabaena sp. FACHB-1237 TaxID=2692769 RepID=UPI001F559009|nr:zf-HC2 domain-containing protein [Anabaena sp. FACHB-1237]